MPLLFLIVGSMFLTAAVRGPDETRKLMALIKGDFTGQNNFLIWSLAVGSIAGLGYVKSLKPFSNVFLTLIFLVIVLNNSGPDGSKNLFTSFYNQIKD